jgi:trehalose-6-phosphate synthase
VFPWKEELLEGLLGNDLLGFHLRSHCQNFLDTIDRTIEAKVDQERSEITRGGKVTVIRPFPISIDYDEHEELTRSPRVDQAGGWRLEAGYLLQPPASSLQPPACRMLILSQFTGTARERTDALLVNPYAVEEMAEAIRQALEMPDAERRRRMEKMRTAVANNNVYRWAGKAVSTLLRFDFPETV